MTSKKKSNPVTTELLILNMVKFGILSPQEGLEALKCGNLPDTILERLKIIDEIQKQSRKN